jgi:hypothetical protein
MVEDDARECVVHAVVDEIAGLAVAHGFAGDARDQRRDRGYKKPSGLGKNLNVLREQSADLGVDLRGSIVRTNYLLDLSSLKTRALQVLVSSTMLTSAVSRKPWIEL